MPTLRRPPPYPCVSPQRLWCRHERPPQVQVQLPALRPLHILQEAGRRGQRVLLGGKRGVQPGVLGWGAEVGSRNAASC